MLETELNYPEHLTKKVAFIQDTHLKKKKNTDTVDLSFCFPHT